MKKWQIELLSVVVITIFLTALLLNYNILKKKPSHNIPVFNKKSDLLDILPVDSIPIGIRKIIAAYPNTFLGATENSLIWSDSTEMIYDDGNPIKSIDSVYGSADLEDQVMAMPYPRIINFYHPKKDEDPGRIRHEPFFLKMYGISKEEIKKNLTEIIWLPNNDGSVLEVTTVNNIHLKLQEISKELDKEKELIRFLANPAGTFNWRFISGTNRLSTHSFGIAIDINTEHSNYWQWDYPDWEENPNLEIQYRNEIELKIVEIFENHGFIWGGRWYHYDTMHFEYRPELLIEI